MSVTARRPSVCAFCQVKQLALGRRRLSSIQRRRLETAAIRPADDGLLLSEAEEGDEDASRISNQESGGGLLRVPNTIEGLQEVALGLDALWKQRDFRLSVLRNLSNPFPEHPSGRSMRVPKGPPKPLPTPCEGLIPHDTFRRNVKEATNDKALRGVLRKQLLRCEWPKDIFRVVAVAMQDKHGALNLTQLYEPLMRSLYRCRQNVTDPEVLRTLNAIVTRFHYASMDVAPELLHMALKFAARSRSLKSMKKYLRLIRETGIGMSSNVFRSVIAKCSIGHRGLGEIRNGRWKRNDLRQVLLGFEDCQDLPEGQKYHFGSFLVRDDWQYLHGWVAVLARCRENDAVWREWELWRDSEARRKPRNLRITDRRMKQMTNKLRGDYWFLEQMAYSGDIERAWTILAETEISFTSLKSRVKDRLLEEAQHAKTWDEGLRAEMVKKYDHDLSRIEQALGVKWIPEKSEGEGHHELYMDQEEALDALGAEGWKLNEDYGYPWEDEDRLVPMRERSLHDAEEGRRVA